MGEREGRRRLTRSDLWEDRNVSADHPTELSCMSPTPQRTLGMS